MERERTTRKTLVGFAESLCPTEPCLVGEETSLVETVKAMATRPGAQVVAVVDGQGKLQGTIPLLALAEEIFVRMVPEEFLVETVDFDKALEFARLGQARLAREIMGPAVAVHREDTLGEAFAKMHRHRLSGLPIVSPEGRVVGYLALVALLLAWLGASTD